MEHFSISASSLSIAFTCPYCGEKIEATLNPPLPNMEADSVEDSYNSDEEEIQCNCDKLFTAKMYSNMYEGSIEVIDEECGENIEYVICEDCDTDFDGFDECEE